MWETWKICILNVQHYYFIFFKAVAFFKFIYLFIYFWLCWVFVSVRGLSLVAASGGHSASRCAGLSLSRPLLLRSTGSRRAGSVVVAHGPSCSVACGLPRPGLEPMSPALAGRFSTTAPPGKPYNIILSLNILLILKPKNFPHSFIFLALKEANPSILFSKSTSLPVWFSVEEIAMFDNFFWRSDNLK